MPVRFVAFEISESSFEDLDRFARSKTKADQPLFVKGSDSGMMASGSRFQTEKGQAYEWHQRRKAARANGEAA
jgi:hypothetical protein